MHGIKSPFKQELYNYFTKLIKKRNYKFLFQITKT